MARPIRAVDAGAPIIDIGINIWPIQNKESIWLRSSSRNGYSEISIQFLLKIKSLFSFTSIVDYILDSLAVILFRESDLSVNNRSSRPFSKYILAGSNPCIYMEICTVVFVGYCKDAFFGTILHFYRGNLSQVIDFVSLEKYRASFGLEEFAVNENAEIMILAGQHGGIICLAGFHISIEIYSWSLH